MEGIVSSKCALLPDGPNRRSVWLGDGGERNSRWLALDESRTVKVLADSRGW